MWFMLCGLKEDQEFKGFIFFQENYYHYHLDYRHSCTNPPSCRHS